MSEPENTPQSGSPVACPETNGEEMRRLVNILFGGMILTSFTLTAFLGVESRRATKDAAITKAQTVELTRAIQQTDADLQAAYTKLSEFARKHPDFQNQILSRYFKFTNAPAR